MYGCKKKIEWLNILCHCMSFFLLFVEHIFVETYHGNSWNRRQNNTLNFFHYFCVFSLCLQFQTFHEWMKEMNLKKKKRRFSHALSSIQNIVSVCVFSHERWKKYLKKKSKSELYSRLIFYVAGGIFFFLLLNYY